MLNLGMEITFKFANFFDVPVSAIKMFDSFERYLVKKLDRKNLAEIPDE
jgi:hypothetical protein